MKFIINHLVGYIEINITKRNEFKHKIDNGILIARQCGDCKLFLDLIDFGTKRFK